MAGRIGEEQFPFDPTHHSKISFNPTVYVLNRLEKWPEEMKGKEYWEMLRMIENHGFLRNFYKSSVPHTEEFEKMYNIVKEELEEKAVNPIMLGWTFESLKNYHQVKAQNPDAVYQASAQIELPVSKASLSIISTTIESLNDEDLKFYISLS